MTGNHFVNRLPCVLLKCIRHTFFCIGLILSFFALGSPTHAGTVITETTGTGDLGTHILPPSGNVFGITGGTPVGANLYHSFAQFNVGTGDIAQFQTGTPSPDHAMQNILGRITDQNPSTIFGRIDSATYYPNANLFLMNPHGFLFGHNATVNIGGMAHFTTADYLKLADGNVFKAIPNMAADAMLTTFPVAAFGFLGSSPAAIAVQGSHLTVANGTGLSLIGGNHGCDCINPDTGETVSVPDGMTMTGGSISAPGGQINLVSVASEGEVLIETLESAANITGNVFTAMGNISLSQGATLNVSGDTAGAVRIRGGQFVITDAALVANTVNPKDAFVAIDINVTGDLSITDTRGVPAISAQTFGSGGAGEIHIISGNLTATSSFVDPSFLPTTLIDSHTETTGNAGYVDITTGNLSVSGLGGFAGFTFINSGTAGPGNGANVTINARDIQTTSTTFVSTGDFLANQVLRETTGVTGSAGNLTIEASSLQLLLTIIDTGSTAAGSETQQAGNLTITAHDINIVNGQIDAIGNARGGAITITADRIVTENTFFETDTVFGPGGGITVLANAVELTNGSTLASNTFGDGNAGDIQVMAHDHLTFLGPTSSSATGAPRPSGLFSNSFAFVGTHGGDAGNIVVTTPRLELAGGRINTSTETGGHGGNVEINANAISMSGEFANPETAEPIYHITDIHPSGIFTKTVGNEFCGGPCGDAGNISVTTASLDMRSGSQIDSGTSSTGHGGDITIHATNQISMSGTLSSGDQVGLFSRTIGTTPDAGSGGDISVTAGQSVTISDGASVSASSTGTGNAGSIDITAGHQFTMTNSSVTTEATQSGGGAIKISTNPGGTVQLTNSTISASVLDGTGGGGSVNIDPQSVILLNSHILATAIQGAGGNIFIATNLLLLDGNSAISASSQFGQNGTITIQSPNAPISGQIHPLGKTPLLATSLLNQQCASVAGGQFSSFTVAGRDSVPTEPGSWLVSPLAMAGVGQGIQDGRLKAEGGQVDGRKTEGEKAEGERPDRQTLTLRQIAPAGFLTQAFAVDRSAGCRS